MKLRTKFQDKDFKLGEVVDASIMYGYKDKIEVYCAKKMKHRVYNSIKHLTDYWEDAPEEPKGSALDLMILTLTNFIENEPDEDKVDLEDCKQMLDKLKAWKRLKDKGFRFMGKTYETDKRFGYVFYKVDEDTYSEDIVNDLDLLFSRGGE